MHGDALRNLKEALQTYKRFRTELEKSYKSTVDNVNELYEVLGIDDSMTKWLRERMKEEMAPVEGFVNKDPIILVSGQINCGKSSLVNEILERTCVPVEKTPCTAMISRLKYSKTDYYQIYNPDGTAKTEKREFNAKKLKKDIKLENTIRETSEAVQCTVEIGLDNPVLEYGIQIYDTPGTNENEALDEVVQKSLDGVLQVLIYVIDGNRSLTKQVIVIEWGGAW
jgi:predicted GTPase